MQNFELEFFQIVLRYAALSVVEPRRKASLFASLAEHGQQAPVLVVRDKTDDSFILIDGYRRVAALKRLRVDTVRALVVPMTETEALLYKHRQETPRRRSAIEEGWLLRELIEGHGMSRSEVAVQLSRSESWVSRRLALISVLPEAVQKKVRMGIICSYSAQKFLVPLARAKKGDCETLVESIGKRHLSTRQFGQLYSLWRSAKTSAQKREIVTKPELALKIADEIKRPSPIPSALEEANRTFIKDFQIVRSILFRILAKLREISGGNESLGPVVLDEWADTRGVFQRLVKHMEGEQKDVESRNKNSRTESASPGARDPEDCP
mgnify:CR=1 FL=1